MTTNADDLDPAELAARLVQSRHFELVWARQLCKALGRMRASKHLERDANNDLFHRHKLSAVALIHDEQPVRKDTLFLVYAQESLIGRLVVEAGLCLQDAFRRGGLKVLAEIAELDRTQITPRSEDES